MNTTGRRTSRRTSAYALTILVTAIVAIAAITAVMAIGADPPWNGLQDASFESGLFYPDAGGYWARTEDMPGNVSIVTTETPEMYATYTNMGNVTVTPYRGTKMLRLGVPRDKNNHQLRGVNSASQSFTPRQSSISVAVRIFSWETRRERGTFTIDVTRTDGIGGSVGTLTAPEPPTIREGVDFPTGPLPQSAVLDIGKLIYLDSKWIRFNIEGLPVGEPVKISYTLTNSHDASHDSWIYVDLANTAPVATDTSTTTDEDTPVLVPLTATDGDDDPLSYAIVSGPSHGSLGTIAGNRVAYTPAVDFSGTDTFTFKAYDGSAYSNVAAATIAVTPVNDAPALTLPSLPGNINEMAAWTFKATAADVDLPANALTFSLLGAPLGASIDPSSGFVSWTPAEAQGPGDYTFTVVVADDGTPVKYDTESITVHVNEVNLAPALALPSLPFSIDEMQEWAFTATASDPDVPSSTLTYSLVAAPAGATIDPTTGAFSWTPAEAQGPGDFTFGVRVTDSGSPSLYDQQSVTVHVNEVNRDPLLILPVLPPSIDEATTWTLQAMASDPDVPANALTFSLAGAPSDASIDPSTGVFSWTPSYEASGTYSFTLAVSDDAGGSDSRVIDVTVNNVNRPPVAVIEMAPDPGHEGDLDGAFAGSSSDPDTAEGDSIAACDWTVIGPDGTQDTTSGDFFSWVLPPNQGTYIVRLTVTDTRGATDTTETSISVGDFRPLVNAVNAEVLQGGGTSLMARTLDQGWVDSHIAAWDIEGATAGGTADDHVAAMSSGIATASVLAGIRPAGAEFSGLVSVRDADSPSSVGTDTVTVRTVASDLSRFETGTSGQPDLHNLDALPGLDSDWSYLAWIQQPGDVDVYEVRSADGGPLGLGTECLISLKDLPTDYDLLVLSTTPTNETTSSLQSAPLGTSEWGTSSFLRSSFLRSSFLRSSFLRSSFLRSSFLRSSYLRSSFLRSSFLRSSFLRSSFLRSSFLRSSFLRSSYLRSPFTGDDVLRDPWDLCSWSDFATGLKTLGWDPDWTSVSSASWLENPLNGYPFSEMSFTGIDGSTNSGTDVDVGELGLDLEGTSLRVVGSSTKRGTSNEVVLANTETSTSRLFVAVVGHLESFSTTPYRLQIEQSRPSDLFEIASSEITGTPLASNTPGSVTDAPAGPLTLFVTQPQRLAALYGQAETEHLLQRLAALSTNPKVNGVTLSLASGAWYDEWDRHPGDIQKANDVADHVRTEIRDYVSGHSSIKYVVVVGDDDIVPYRRVVDETVVSNESTYWTSAGLQLGSPLLASIYGGFNLSDDFYVDDVPTPWQGRALYLPDRAISRLIETPDEMCAQIDAFLDPDGDGELHPEEAGVLKSDTAMVSGYHFFADGAQRVAEILRSANMSVTTMTTDSWTASELETSLTGSTSDLGVPNAHYTHYAAISANGFWRSETEGIVDPAELMTAQDLVGLPGSGSPFAARLIMTMGCHAGLSVPDGDAEAPESPYEPDTALDFAQTIARQGGVFVGSTGYGLGETNGIAGTEALMGYFASQAAAGGGASVGDALARAKRDYVMALNAVTVYDEKSVIQFAMYGLPQWTLPVTHPADAFSATGQANAVASMPEGLPTAFSLNIVDGEEPTETIEYPFGRVTTDAGTYFTASGNAQFTALRPVQPKVVVPLDGGLPVHGVVYEGARYTAVGPLFDPVISRPADSWEAQPQEPQVAVTGWWPHEPALVTSQEAADGTLSQNLVVTPGQFQADQTDPEVVGTQRLYSSLTVKILRSASTTDWVAPTVTDIRLIRTDPNDSTRLRVSVKATDVSGVGMISVLDFKGELLGKADFSGVRPDANGWYSVEPVLVEPDQTDYNLVLQVADVWSNVTTVTHKGESIPALSVKLTPSTTSYMLDVPVVFHAEVASFSTLLSPPVWYYIDYRDGTGERGILEGDGTASAYFTHTYTKPAAGPVLFSLSDATGLTGGASADIELIEQRADSYVAPAPVGSDATGDGSAEHPFETPHRALPVTEDNGTIWVQPGFYADNVVFNRPVSLIATGSGEAFVNAADTTNPVIRVNGVPEGMSIEGIHFLGTNTTDGIIKITGGSDVIISDCSLTNGTAVNGGGVHAEDSSLTLDRTTITGCSGGGVYASNSTLRVVNCLITHNSGGGVNVVGTSGTFINDTIADNTDGAGISCTGAVSDVFNSILSGNASSAGPQQVTGCDVDYSYVGPNTVSTGVTLGAGVIPAAAGVPGFVNAAGPDYSLLPESICIDAGVASWTGLAAPAVDLPGNARPWSGLGCDLGAYEYQGPAASLDDVYVSTTGDDANRGTYVSPKRTIQAGLDAVNGGGRVHVFAGAYAGGLSVERPVTLLSEDAPLAATISGSGASTVIKIRAAFVTISGFVITGGATTASGGGIDVDGSLTTTIADCSITGNTALNGAGIALYGGTLRVLGSSITGNVATGYGGAIDVNGGALWMSGDMVQNNVAAVGGAAVALRDSSSGYCENSILDGNAVSGSMGQGGGFALGAGASLTLVNSDVTRNRAYWGSAASWGDAPVVVFNCIFWKNSSTKSQFSSPNSRTLPAPYYSFCDDASGKINNNVGGVKVDPGLANVDANDFRLLPSSICINKGADSFSGVNAPTYDMAGNERPYQDTDPTKRKWDIGAYEWGYPK